MLLAVTDELALQPAVDRTVVPLNVVVKSGVELVGVKDLDSALLPSRTDGLPLPEVDLHVNHAMWEWL